MEIYLGQVRINFHCGIPRNDNRTEKWEAIVAQGTTPHLPLSSLLAKTRWMSLPIGNPYPEGVVFSVTKITL